MSAWQGDMARPRLACVSLVSRLRLACVSLASRLFGGNFRAASPDPSRGTRSQLGPAAAYQQQRPDDHGDDANDRVEVNGHRPGDVEGEGPGLGMAGHHEERVAL